MKIDGLESKNSFYLMTTQGLFLLSLEIDSSKQLSFKYLSSYEGNYDINFNLQSLVGIQYRIWDSLITMTNGLGNSLILVHDRREQNFKTDSPAGVEVVRDHIYVTNFNSRMVTMFTKSKALPITDKYFEAEEGPTVIKYVEWGKLSE